MEIKIIIDTKNLMYHTYPNGVLIDARDGYEDIQEAIEDAISLILQDKELNYGRGGFIVTFGPN